MLMGVTICVCCYNFDVNWFVEDIIKVFLRIFFSMSTLKVKMKDCLMYGCCEWKLITETAVTGNVFEFLTVVVKLTLIIFVRKRNSRLFEDVLYPDGNI